jgi:hypothetical protein
VLDINSAAERALKERVGKAKERVGKALAKIDARFDARIAPLAKMLGALGE